MPRSGLKGPVAVRGRRLSPVALSPLSVCRRDHPGRCGVASTRQVPPAASCPEVSATPWGRKSGPSGGSLQGRVTFPDDEVTIGPVKRSLGNSCKRLRWTPKPQTVTLVSSEQPLRTDGTLPRKDGCRGRPTCRPVSFETRCPFSPRVTWTSSRPLRPVTADTSTSRFPRVTGQNQTPVLRVGCRNLRQNSLKTHIGASRR